MGRARVPKLGAFALLAHRLKRPKALYDVAQQIKLPPPPDPDVTNDTGLPRRLIALAAC